MTSNNYEELIAPVDKAILKSELTSERLLKNTKSGSNQLYVVDAFNSPNVMREIGRLRELSFRDAGGGTGLALDIDDSDTAYNGYKQLIVWDPDGEEILGGYRYIISTSSRPEHLSTEHYFKFTDKFRQEYLPYMIELGRSFVQPKYQGRRGNAKGLFALDNLWEGIGAIASIHPHIKYFFGKVTMYVEYDNDARNELIYFLKKYFNNEDELLIPIYPKKFDIDEQAISKIYSGETYADDYKTLMRRIKEHGEVIPPLINAYMNLSPSLQVFSTVTNPDFGGVEETGILVTIDDIYANKYDRYINGNYPYDEFRHEH